VRSRLILQGELGTGKSTFAREVLRALGIRQKAEGSPTFAIAHEYLSEEGIRIVHADGYRLKSEAELEATGLLETLWDGDSVVLFEWLDLFPETERALRKSEMSTIWVRLSFPPKTDSNRDSGDLRQIKITRSGT
jgi:tRNA threonylcarbamoyl adenosine modification protein YjeE